MPTITPTVGRKVYFYRDAAQAEPIDATIIKVHAAPDQATPTSCVNLACHHPDTGEAFTIHSAQASDEPVDHPHYRWMPYQVGQAKAAS